MNLSQQSVAASRLSMQAILPRQLLALMGFMLILCWITTVQTGFNGNNIHTDQLGTPQKMPDARQKIVWDRISEPFGATLDIKGQATLNLRFPGQYHDAESGLDYNLFRSYNPETGRYTQSDPIGLLGGLNSYGYVGQNPVNRTDFRGLNSDDDQPYEYGPNSNPFNPLGPNAGPKTPSLLSQEEMMMLERSNASKATGGGQCTPKPSPNFVPPTNPPQQPVIPEGWVPRPGTRGGTIWQSPGMDSSGPAVRVMTNPTPGYPNGRWIETNGSGQPLDPRTGKPGDPWDTHIPLPP